MGAAAAAASAAWKKLLGQRALSADKFSGHAARHLIAAFLHLEDPIDMKVAAEGAVEGVEGAVEGVAGPAVEGARDKVAAALDSLGLAAGAASLAAADMFALQIVGLRGASTSPAQPLTALEDIRDNVLRTALLILRAAHKEAEEAFHLIKVARAHLYTIQTLVSLDGTKEMVDDERGLAIAALLRASAKIQSFCEHADCARQLL